MDVIDLVDCTTDEESLENANGPVTTHVPSPTHISFISTSPLRWDETKGAFYLTKNIKCGVLDVQVFPPPFYPAQPDGFATFVNLNSPEMLSIRRQHELPQFIRLLYETSYSIEFRNSRQSTVILQDGEEFLAQRKTAKCTGVKSCAYSTRSASVHHEGKVVDTILDANIAPSGGTMVDDELELARQVFFFAQNTFPTTCKHRGLPSSGTRDGYVSKQRRHPNWVFRTGKPVHTETHGATQRPDFIGCADFGQPGVRDTKRCDIRTLPSHLQNANSTYVNRLILDAMNGTFPFVTEQATHACPPLPRNHSGKHCDRHVHGFEAVPLVSVPCQVVYHFLIHYRGSEPAWMIVVGTGTHEHRAPVRRPAQVSVTRIVRDLHAMNPLVTVKELRDRVSSSCQAAAPIATLRNQHHVVKKKANPYGQSINALVQQQSVVMESGELPYISVVLDEREADKSRQTRDQVGVVILLCYEKLLRRSASSPNFGVDGTFNMVARCSDKMNYELVSIVAKDPATGTSFSVLRQVASRKTVASRKVLFTFFLKKLREFGMPDPLYSSPSQRLTVSSDFETTYGIALGQSLCDVYRPEGNIMSEWESYIRLVCFGCDVHAKRIVLEKLNNTTDEWVYAWAVGTRLLTNREDISFALRTMCGMGDKWKSFSSWLSSNTVAFILWFSSYFKKGNFASRYPNLRVMWTTNPNEAMHSRIKAMPEYRLTSNRGLQLFGLITMLERVDMEDFANITGERGTQYYSTPLWRRSAKKRARRSSDGTVLVNGVHVSASEPKRARRTAS